MRIADHVDRSARGLGELGATELHRLGQLRVREPGERVVAKRVESNGHPGVGERSHLRAPDSRHRRGRPRRGRASLSVARSRSSGDISTIATPSPWSDEGVVTPAVPTTTAGRSGTPASNARWRRSKWNENGRSSDAPLRKNVAGAPQLAQDRQRDRRVTREVVVERDRHGESPAAPSRSHCVEQTICGHDVVVLDDVAELALEQLRFVRRNELARRDRRRADPHCGT